ncbi:TonB-dependent hemoglobin/transferrin/lactoferrin family receptor [Halopseudomonas formosensis]|uniref:TonB-dependent hemoglobin/transferrin/lactoferrin family receptor n=1 Tax=Halopseudomonas formosensis TaxID=1002526 RepID=A0ABU5BY62_9GAMM|nr:TonB-dependent hemoglobin/transferrin/lactoferrin family receptor [Halopseudomonas formosensis]MDX9687690.1 TonB-dependent hemoglobin/transferrin/lactoferrin family receptor [Halopseudomonas formosensis]
MKIRPSLARHGYLALLITPTMLLAQERPVTQFDTITVTATRSEQRLDEVPSTVTVHDEQQVDQQNINDIRDLVRYEPGVSVGGTGSRFGLSGFSIRGIGGNRVLTQVDGVAVPDAFTFGPFLSARRDYVDPDTLKSVEIIRGPASSLYGSDALGGAVSFVTRDAGDYLDEGDDQALRLKTGYDGSDDSWHRSATLAGRRGSLDALLHLSRRDGQATDTYGGRGGIGAAREKANPQDKERENLLFKLGWDYREGDRLQLAYELFEDDIRTRIRSDESLTATTRRHAAVDTSERERFTLSHDMRLASPLAQRLRWSLSYQDSQMRQITDQERFTGGTLRQRERDSRYEEQAWSLNTQLDTAFRTGQLAHDVTYGFDLRRLESSDLRSGWEIFSATGQPVPPSPFSETFPISDFPDPVTEEYALFVQDRMQIGRWTLLAGLRYDHYRLKPKVTPAYLNGNPVERDPGNFSDGQLSPKLGITYKIDDVHSLYGQYAAGFRAPNAVDIFGEFVNVASNYQTLANTNLKPETSDSLEVGLRGQYDSGSFGLALFYNRYDDFIEQVTLANDPTGNNRLTFQYQNLDRVVIRGAELRGELFLDSLGLPEGSTLRGSLAYARGKDEQTGQPLNSIDPLKGVLGLGYNAPSGRYGGELVWTLVDDKSRIDDSTANQFEPAGYGLLDLHGFLRVADNLTLNAGLFNLTDKQHWHWTDVRGLTADNPGLGRYSQPGRHAAMNLVWEL